MGKHLDRILATLGCCAIIAVIIAIAYHGPEFAASSGPVSRPSVAIAGGMQTSAAPVLRPATEAAPVGVGRGGHSRDDFFHLLAQDESILLKGHEQYAMFCAACHGVGNIGDDSPSNLFNNRWVHGGAPSDIERLIRVGYLDAGMPGWDEMLPDETIEAIVAYLLASQTESET